MEIASFDHRPNHLAKRHVEPPDELAPRPLTPREHSLQQRGVIEPRQVVALALLGSAPRPARGRTSRERDSAHRIADLASAPKNEATEIRDGIARMSAAAARRAPLAGDAGAGLLGPGQQRHAPNGSTGTLYEDRCPTGYALNGFNLAATNEIDNDKPVCARADLTPSIGGGWQSTWGPTTFLPYHGPTGDPGDQRRCPAGSFVRGFSRPRPRTCSRC